MGDVSNPAKGLRLDEPRSASSRERTFRSHEIGAILSAALNARPTRKDPTLLFAKRWCPWLAAYSGARISELTHLHGNEVRQEHDIWVMDLTRTKGGLPRTVPLHEHLIEQGFLEFVGGRGPGPLFFDPTAPRERKTSGAELRAGYLARWVRQAAKLTDLNVDPNHGWRHTFKTIALGAAIPERINDAITGHKPVRVPRQYETPTVAMLAEALARFPRYVLPELQPSTK